MDGHTAVREKKEGVVASSAHQNFAHVRLSCASEVHQNPWILLIFSLRTSQTRHVPDSSNQSLYLIKLLSSSYPQGNVGGNWL